MHFPSPSTSALSSRFRLHRVVWALLASIFLPTCSPGIEPLWGARGFWNFQTSGGAVRFLHQEYLQVPDDWRSQSGALGLNLEREKDPDKPWFIEYQRLGGEFVQAGLAEKNDEAVEWGLKVLEYGFSKMDGEGSFPQPDRYHSASFFIEAAARALLLLSVAPGGERWKDAADRLRPKVAQAAHWMVRSDVHADNWPDPNLIETKWGERRYGHRRYLDAAALGLTGILTRDTQLLDGSREILRDGLAFQRPDGVSPEKGGHDSSYQAVGLMYACRYYQMVADRTLRREMDPVLQKGFAWMVSRIRPDGTIEDAGNTRTGPGAELGRRGKPKTVDFQAAAMGLAHWGWLNQDEKLRKKAQRVLEAGQKKTP